MISIRSLALACSVLSLASTACAVTPETRYLEREDGRIAYDDSGGSGPLVVALPGMGDLREQYRLLRPRLVQAGYRVVTMDVRGHGETSATWPDYSARAVGSDAIALIRLLGADRAVILGNSFSAGAALWAAHDQPSMIRGVGMLGPIVRDQPVDPLTSAVLRIGLGGPWRVWFWMTYWNSLFPLNKPADHPDARERLTHNLREPGRMDALRTMVGLSKSDTEAIVGQNPVPVLVVMGSRDPDFKDPVAEATWVSSKTQGRTFIVDGAGHYPHLETPDPVASEIVRFLDGLQKP